MTRRKSAGLCVISIDHMEFLLPSKDAFVVLELLDNAQAVQRTYDIPETWRHAQRPSLRIQTVVSGDVKSEPADRSHMLEGASS